MLPTNAECSNATPLRRRAISTLTPSGDAAPWVSIISSHLLAEIDLHATVRTVLCQTLQQWEWIIVDGGSLSAHSRAILQQYCNQDPRIRVMPLAVQCGVGAARNVGVAAARAPLIMHLDGRHEFEATALESLAWYLEARSDVAYVTAEAIGYDVRRYAPLSTLPDAPPQRRPEQIAPAVLLRRSMHDAVGGYDESVSLTLADATFWQCCAAAGYRGATVPGDRADHAVATSPRRHDWPSGNERTTSNRHLLFIVPWMSLGGADKFNLDLLDQVRRHGWDVTVVTTREDEDVWYTEYLCRTPEIFSLHRFLPLRDYPRFLAYLIQSRHSDAVLISHSELGYRLLPYLRGRFPNVALLDYLHVVEPSWNHGGYPRFAVDYRAHLDFTVTSSDTVREWISTRGVPVSQSAVCYTAVDTDRNSPDPAARHEERTRLNAPSDQVVILFVGRLCAQKNPRILIAALDRVLRAHATASAWIVGDGPDRSLVEADVDSRGLSERIHVMGAVSPETIGRLMSAADIFFLPSRYEGISLALYEAMASGLPSVASDVGGQRELVTDETGILVRPQSFDEDLNRYVSALEALVIDSDYRQRLGRAARARVVAHFALPTMGTCMVQLIEGQSRRRAAAPRLMDSEADSVDRAEQALELTRLASRSESLSTSRSGESVREWLYIGLQALFAPAYEWAATRGWRWPLAIGGRLRRSLLMKR